MSARLYGLNGLAFRLHMLWWLLVHGSKQYVPAASVILSCIDRQSRSMRVGHNFLLRGRTLQSQQIGNGGLPGFKVHPESLEFVFKHPSRFLIPYLQPITKYCAGKFLNYWYFWGGYRHLGTSGIYVRFYLSHGKASRLWLAPIGRDPGLFWARWFSAVDPTIPLRGTGWLSLDNATNNHRCLIWSIETPQSLVIASVLPKQSSYAFPPGRDLQHLAHNMTWSIPWMHQLLAQRAKLSYDV